MLEGISLAEATSNHERVKPVVLVVIECGASVHQLVNYSVENFAKYKIYNLAATLIILFILK